MDRSCLACFVGKPSFPLHQAQVVVRKLPNGMDELLVWGSVGFVTTFA